MPPASRGAGWLRILRRYVATSTTSKLTSRSPMPRIDTKSRLPPGTNSSRSTEAKLRSVEPQKPTSGSSNPPPSFTKTFFHGSKYRYFRRAVLASPVLFIGWMHFPYEFLPVQGQSMSPFLNPGSSDTPPSRDWVLILRGHPKSPEHSTAQKREGTAVDNDQDYQRGQVVIYDSPHKPGRVAVKRIVAVPGDLVHPLPGYSGGDGLVTVPFNHVWVEGDIGKRDGSVDSNWFGPISQNLIIGEVRAIVNSWLPWKWTWIDWSTHRWPAQERGRVDQNAIMEATVDPDRVNYNSGWTDGSIGLILDRMRKQPEQMLYSFVNDAKWRQEARRLYNNALYVTNVATAEDEKQLARTLLEEMEDLYGREALVYGIRMKRQARDRGELPNAGNSKIGEKLVKDPAASEAENWLKNQGWEVERNSDGTVKTSPAAPR